MTRFSERTEAGLRAISGRWKARIIGQLLHGSAYRFSELKRALPGISHRMLSQQLRGLEHSGLLSRFSDVTTGSTKYELTARGRSLKPLIDAIHEWVSEN